MKNLNLKNIILGILALFGIGTGAMVVGGQSDSVAHYSSIGTMGTSGAMMITTTSAQVVATSSTREALIISNLSSYAIYCNANADKAAVGYSGIMIPASTTLSFDSELAYTGAVRCISPLGNASTSVYSRAGN
jgi:hypothetical protein